MYYLIGIELKSVIVEWKCIWMSTYKKELKSFQDYIIVPFQVQH
jgi:hypothetical protein